MGVPLNLTDIQSGFLTASALTSNNTLIEQALNKALDRTGASDNAMEIALDMGLNNINNLAVAVDDFQGVPLKQLRDFIAANSTDITSTIDVEPEVTATEGQTVVNLSSINYVPGTNGLQVYINGVYQRPGRAYNETSSSSITFLSPLKAGDLVDIFGARFDTGGFIELTQDAAASAEQSAASAEQSATDAGIFAQNAEDAAGYKLNVNDQTGITYTLVAEDEGDFIRMDNAAENTITVPANTSVPFDVGTVILVRQIGEGTTTINPAIGVTVNVPFDNYDISQTDFGIALVKVATDEWDMIKAFGGVDSSELVAFSQEFDARLQDFYTEILSSDPTFVVNFDQLQSNVDSSISDLQAEVDTLSGNSGNSIVALQNQVDTLTNDFGVIETDFGNLQTDFGNIETSFGNIESDVNTLQSDVSTLQSDFSGFETLISDTNDALDALNLDGDFENSLAPTGYQKLPGGLIMQWGTIEVPPRGVRTVTYPIAFPTVCANITLGTNNTYPLNGIVELAGVFDSVNNISFRIFSRPNGDSGGFEEPTVNYHWFAVGY